MTIIKTNMDDDFTCKCGNQAWLEGFHPCNIDGEYVEPDLKWKGHYKCDRCGQIYLDESI